MADKQASTVPVHDPKQSSDYIPFPCLPPGGPLNRWSTKITREHDYPGAQVCCNQLAAAHQRLTDTTRPLGYALRSRCPKRGQDEECTSGWCCYRLVGRQPLQVSFGAAHSKD